MQWEEIFWVEGNSLSKVTKVRKYKVYGGNFKYSGKMQRSYYQLVGQSGIPDSHPALICVYSFQALLWSKDDFSRIEEDLSLIKGV